MALFMIPQDPWNLRKTNPILDWKTVQNSVSWGVIILIGGGFALAHGCETSGLSKNLSKVFNFMSSDIPPAVACFIFMMAAAFLTECTSNAATCTVLLPIMKPLVRFSNFLCLF